MVITYVYVPRKHNTNGATHCIRLEQQSPLQVVNKKSITKDNYLIIHKYGEIDYAYSQAEALMTNLALLL